jgi:hypothetical protein
MKKFIAGFFLTAALFGCGSDGGSGEDDSLPGMFSGTWQGLVGLAENNCRLTNVPDQFQFQVMIEQEGNRVTVNPGTCGSPFEGAAMGNSFTASQMIGTVECDAGEQVAVRYTIEFAEVISGQARSVRHVQEAQCPLRQCRVVHTGVASRTTTDLVPCVPPGTGSSSSASATPTPSPTPGPAGCGECDVAGCCLNHGGVSLCTNQGVVQCQDGTFSVSCRC